MRRIQLPVFLILFVYSLALASQPNLSFLVGAAEDIISPTDTAYIAGHTRNRIFKGIHDDIFVKALVVSNKENTIAILTFDCIGMLHPELLRIRKAVKKLTDHFPVEHIMMTSTHTHSGPDVVGLWGPDLMHSGVDSNYLENVIQKSASLIIEAMKRQQQAYAIYSTAEHGHDWVYNISEPKELDRSVTILQFKNEQHEVIASLTNFACHPTFLDAVNEEVSADYIGGYYQELNKSFGGINFFLQGAIGGWVQPEHEPKTAEQAFFRGRELAEKVKVSLKHPSLLSGNEILVKSKLFQLPVENQGFIQLSQMGVLSRKFSDSVQTEVAVFSIGNAFFATHPGETVPALSGKTKALMNNDGPRFILGLGMDALGYILKPDFFDEAKAIPHSPYLCSVSLGPKTEELVFNTLKDLIHRLQLPENE